MSDTKAAEGGAAKKPDFSGWLTKRSMWLKDWRKRWFVLDGNKLHFSKTPTDEPHGSINLSTCLTVKSAEDKTDKRNSFEVATPDATYYMYAESEKLKDEWIGAIGRAIVRYSNAFTNDDGYDEGVSGSDDETESEDDDE